MAGAENPVFDRDQHTEKPVTPTEYSRGTDPNKENDMEGNNTSNWSIFNFVSRHKKVAQRVFNVILNALILGYLITAVMYFNSQGDCDLEWCNGLGMLIILIVLLYLGLSYYYILKKYFGKWIYNSIMEPISEKWNMLMTKRYLKVAAYLLPLVAIIVYLGLDASDNLQRLQSCFGVIVILILGFVFSRYPGQINWRPVILGLYIQFVLGLIVIRWSVGRSIFQCIANKVATFLGYADAGSSFVYGDMLIGSGVFAFKALSVIFFLSFVVQILYYYGAMQWFMLSVGWLLQKSMGTTVCESVNAAASIFIGMSESPLLFKPLIKDLTRSEVHAVMTEGFATVSGTVLAAYISFGAQPAHILTASIMSAPAALCMAKLLFPETEQSKTTTENIKLERGEESSVVDAATKGAMMGTQLVLGIIANLIAFVSFVAFINGILSWLGMLVGFEGFTLEFILRKVFIPLAWIMGVEWKECEEVARLVGIKTIINEFVAYQQMGESKRAGLLSPRSELIATYALCGFSNIASVGIMIGALVSMAPENRNAITEVAFRAFIAGSATCFLTACIAGMLSADEDLLSSPAPMPVFDM